jgi:hypothetical protein
VPRFYKGNFPAVTGWKKRLLAVIIGALLAHHILNATEEGLDIISILFGSLRHLPDCFPWW